MNTERELFWDMIYQRETSKYPNTRWHEQCAVNTANRETSKAFGKEGQS